MKTGRIKNKELRLKKKDGTLFWGSCTATVKHDDQGNLLWIDGILQDITEQKAMEEEIKQANQQLMAQNQQLRAHEQQLVAMNRELQAKNHSR